MRNAEMIIRNLQELLEINDDIRKNGEEAEYNDGIVYEGEYGEYLTEYIDCPHFSGSCLAEDRKAKYGSYEWEENCRICKALWLMNEV